MPLIAYPISNLGRASPDETEDLIRSLPVDRTELVLMTPSRQVHENEATRDVVTVNRGPAYWFLTLTFGSVEVGSDLYRKYTSWLSRMHDLRNYSNVPIGDYAFKEELNYVAGIDARSITAVSGNTRTLDHPLYWGGTLQGTPPAASAARPRSRSGPTSAWTTRRPCWTPSMTPAGASLRVP